MSLRMVPQKGHAQQTALAPSAPAAPGVHDTLRSNQSLNTPHNASPAFSAVASSHPLEARLNNWRSTQDSLKMTMLRREFGVGEPVRRGMEVKICQEGEWRPAVLGYKGEGVHEQILSGRDASVDWEDVFNGNETQNAPDFHSEMENKLKMNW
ncbi:proteasome maturation factor UMP1 [Aureobasidium pullulans]|uniref:Proteasome maturation factor UMP1 n=1 Tax=Aureobasidium pullulans TaxID=5580 RepID=A0A4S9LV04_AURPU|nr:proteasome maturation factor UMP1 [Aureobasidium pullulans]